MVKGETNFGYAFKFITAKIKSAIFKEGMLISHVHALIKNKMGVSETESLFLYVSKREIGQKTMKITTIPSFCKAAIVRVP